MDYAPAADFELLLKAHEAAKLMGLQVKSGNILSSDTFYDDEPEAWRLWAEYGVLAIEMETSILYTLAAKFKVKALSILTVSDNIPLGTALSAEDRQTSFDDMVKLALELV